MKGNNKITINQATMCEAIEHWLKTKVFEATNDQRVIKVERSQGSGYVTAAEEFDIQIAERVPGATS